jgi:NADH-quinone oxidoreductase subunit C
VTATQLADAVRSAVRGSVVGHDEGLDMPTLTVKPETLVEVCTYLRDQQDKNFLSDVCAVDHLGYGDDVAGYFGTERGRDINATGSWGAAITPEPPPKRFAVRYHMAHVGGGSPERVRLQVWVDDGEEVPSVVSVWPTADWLEREQYDLMGIVFAGHPNLRRLIMPHDWDGHPLRKDYPIGGEPVQFTDAE